MTEKATAGSAVGAESGREDDHAGERDPSENSCTSNNSQVLPRRPRGRPSVAAAAECEQAVAAFCDLILEINSTLDFRVSSRGWGYILEGRGLISKGDLDAAQKLINDCRKNGD